MEDEIPEGSSSATAGGRVADLDDPDVRRSLAPAALAALMRLGQHWTLDAAEISDLLGTAVPGAPVGRTASPSVELDADGLTRASLLLDIDASLHQLFTGDLADAWVRRPNSNATFAGRSPLEVMRSGGIAAMIAVRALLDSRRAGM